MFLDQINGHQRPTPFQQFLSQSIGNTLEPYSAGAAPEDRSLERGRGGNLSEGIGLGLPIRPMQDL